MLGLVAASRVLIRRYHDLWASILISLAVCLKPQDGLLVTLALLVAGRRRTFVAAAVTLATPLLLLFKRTKPGEKVAVGMAH